MVHPFRAAIEARDMHAVVALLAEDVIFDSPVVYRAYRGRQAVAPILHAVSQVFEDFHYVREYHVAGTADHALVFRARIGANQVEGCDFLGVGADGAIDRLTVMVRPLSSALALAEAMQRQLAEADVDGGGS